MGFLDAILGGKKKLKGPAPDRLFAMSTAYVTLDTGHQIKTKGVAGIVFQPLATADFESIATEMEEILRGPAPTPARRSRPPTTSTATAG